MSVRLETIDLQILLQYQASYTEQWPKYCAEFYCLDNFIGFLQKEPHMKNLKAYTLSEQSAKDAALFLIVVRSGSAYAAIDIYRDICK